MIYIKNVTYGWAHYQTAQEAKTVGNKTWDTGVGGSISG